MGQGASETQKKEPAEKKIIAGKQGIGPQEVLFMTPSLGL